MKLSVNPFQHIEIKWNENAYLNLENCLFIVFKGSRFSIQKWLKFRIIQYKFLKYLKGNEEICFFNFFFKLLFLSFFLSFCSCFLCKKKINWKKNHLSKNKLNRLSNRIDNSFILFLICFYICIKYPNYYTRIILLCSRRWFCRRNEISTWVWYILVCCSS